MTKKLILATVLILSFTLVSCKTKTNSDENTQNNNKPAVEDNQNTTSSKDNDDKKSDDSKENVKEDVTNSKTLSIYQIDDNTLEPNEISTIELKSDSSLENDLQDLSNAVSKNFFDGLPIKVKAIDTIDGKKIATINLIDGNNLTWVDRFQGSTGGQITTNTLIENFLQVNYKDEWIDGVKFLYNDSPIEYEHVSPLSEIKYRN